MIGKIVMVTIVLLMATFVEALIYIPVTINMTVVVDFLKYLLGFAKPDKPDKQ